MPTTTQEEEAYAYNHTRRGGLRLQPHKKRRLMPTTTQEEDNHTLGGCLRAGDGQTGAEMLLVTR
jgi:hypothetical protein